MRAPSPMVFPWNTNLLRMNSRSANRFYLPGLGKSQGFWKIVWNPDGNTVLIPSRPSFNQKFRNDGHFISRTNREQKGLLILHVEMEYRIPTTYKIIMYLQIGHLSTLLDQNRSTLPSANHCKQRCAGHYLKRDLRANISRTHGSQIFCLVFQQWRYIFTFFSLNWPMTWASHERRSADFPKGGKFVYRLDVAHYCVLYCNGWTYATCYYTWASEISSDRYGWAVISPLSFACRPAKVPHEGCFREFCSPVW
jgi:hypothetical protein